MPQIVVVDDEPLVCSVVEDILVMELGAEVLWAASGGKGAEILASRTFDLALIDMGMPEVSGATLAELAANQNTPSILITGDPDATAKALGFGFPYLPKPFQVQELVELARLVIARNVENVHLVKEAAARMAATAQRLNDAISESHRLLETTRQTLTKATVPPSAFVTFMRDDDGQ
jgi:two-component system catabolic regulation response regulator CreB